MAPPPSHLSPRLGNAFTLWLGMTPPELFLYAFLPPLLLDAALSIDYFLFNKVKPQVICFSFLVVVASTLASNPVLLYLPGLSLAAHGWRWQHAALFAGERAGSRLGCQRGGRRMWCSGEPRSP